MDGLLPDWLAIEATPSFAAAMSESKDAAPTFASVFSDSHDLVPKLAAELNNPLGPQPAIHLSGTAKGLRRPMQAPLAQLRARHVEARALAARIGMESHVVLRDVEDLRLGRTQDAPLALTHWRTLGMLIGCRSMLRLQVIEVYSSHTGAEGLASFAAGVCDGGLPWLTGLFLCLAHIGPRTAAALAAALTHRTLPSLAHLGLPNNPLGNAGLAALAPALRQLPTLQTLSLTNTSIGDEGLAALVAPPTAGVLGSLVSLYIGGNEITDAGCATLASSLRGGALPALGTRHGTLHLVDNPVSQHAQQEVMEVLRITRWEPRRCDS